MTDADIKQQRDRMKKAVARMTEMEKLDLSDNPKAAEKRERLRTLCTEIQDHIEKFDAMILVELKAHLEKVKAITDSHPYLQIKENKDQTDQYRTSVLISFIGMDEEFRVKLKIAIEKDLVDSFNLDGLCFRRVEAFLKIEGLQHMGPMAQLGIK